MTRPRGNRRTTRLAICLSAALLVVTAACGSDDDDTAGSSDETAGSSAGTSAVSGDTSGDTAGSSGDTAGSSGDTANSSADTSAAPDDTPAEGAAEPEQGGEATWFVFIAMSSLDPKMNPVGGACCDAGQIYGIYDSLVRVDANGEITPRLAQSVTSNDAFTTWTIELRPDLTFTDDTPLDAEAVKVNMERHKDPELGSRCILDAMQVANATVESPTTLTVQLVGPNSQFPILLQGCLGLIASPTALEQYGDTYGSTPETTVGAGPFTVESFSANTGSVLVRNPNFWDAPRPYLDRIEIVSAAANAQTAAEAILSGDAQLATFMMAPGPHLKTLEDAGYEPIASQFFGGQGWGFNTTRPPLDDARVRRALTLAIDVDELNEQVFAGTAPRGRHVLSRGLSLLRPIAHLPGVRPRGGAATHR